MSDSTDYEAVTIPGGKPRKDHSDVERRAEILDQIERAGHPGVLNKSQLAREYGVSHTSIGRDFDALAEYVAGNLDRDHSFVMDRVLRGAVWNLVEDGEHYTSVKAAEKWYDFLVDVGEVTRAPERCELDTDATVADEQTETEDYRLITDEGEVLGDGEP